MPSKSPDSSCPVDLLGPKDGVQESFCTKQVFFLLFVGKMPAPFDICGLDCWFDDPQLLFTFLFTGDAFAEAVVRAADCN